MAFVPPLALRNPTPSMGTRCGRCNQSFTTSRALLRHLRETRGHKDDSARVTKNYQCHKCSETFSRDYDRRRHERRFHDSTRKKRIVRKDKQILRRAIKSGSNEAHPISLLERGLGVVDEDIQFKTTELHGASQDKSGWSPIGSPIDGQSIQRSSETTLIEQTSLPLRPGRCRPRRRNTLDDKPILCTICRSPFDTNNIQQLLNHLNDHFRGFTAAYTCTECQIDFAQKADLDKHRISAATGHCGFKFHHSKPCSGHHPPGEDHVRLWQRIRNWQQCQLKSYIDRVDQLSRRPLGQRYIETENNNKCRGCRILEFYEHYFPGEYRNVCNTHMQQHQGLTDGQTPRCCQSQLTDNATEQLIISLNSRRHRASSADGDYVARDVDIRETSENETITGTPFTVPTETNPTDILDASYLANPLQGLLHWSACAGDSNTVKACVRNGADISGTDISGRSALHWAAASGSCDTVEMLLDYDASVALADNAGQTPLFLAVQCGNSDVLELLLRRGANPSVKDTLPQACLHIAAESGDVTVIHRLLSYGAEVNTLDWFDRIALHLAAKGGRLEAVSTLCNHGASIDAKDSAGRTPLAYALESGNFGVACYLLIDRLAVVSEDMVSKAINNGADEMLIEQMRRRIADNHSKYDRH